LPDLGVFPESIAVAPDVDDVTVAQEPIDQCCGHDFVSENGAPFFKALVRGQHRGSPLIAGSRAGEEHGSGVAHGQVADLVHHQE
jgi:hypothetical protein